MREDTAKQRIQRIARRMSDTPFGQHQLEFAAVGGLDPRCKREHIQRQRNEQHGGFNRPALPVQPGDNCQDNPAYTGNDRQFWALKWEEEIGQQGDPRPEWY
jgi:hypothetical protein